MEGKRKRRRGWTATIWLAILLFLYVQSSGPVHLAWHRIGDTGKLRIYRTAYAPLYWISEQLGWDDEFEQWRRWWTPTVVP